MAALRRRAVLRPGDADGAYDLGVTLPLLGTREDGRRWMGYAVRLDPSRWGGWDRLARAAAAAGDDRLTGLALRRATVLSPGSVDALKDLARFAEERSRYRRWLMVEPGSDEARMEVAALALSAGDPAAAGVRAGGVRRSSDRSGPGRAAGARRRDAGCRGLAQPI